jgi:ribonuclease HII
MTRPDDQRERQIGGRVAGVDEAGRGPWAGPVVAAAVILDPARIPLGLADSKMLRPAARAALFELICADALVGIGEASVAEIDTLNILRANDLAMRRALAALPGPAPDHVLIDGNRIPPDWPGSATALVKGDALSVSIAAASIVAKVHRDQLMARLDSAFPVYGWARNQGYGTAAHAAALAAHGVSPHHRRSFAPVRAYLKSQR